MEFIKQYETEVDVNKQFDEVELDELLESLPSPIYCSSPVGSDCDVEFQIESVYESTSTEPPISKPASLFRGFKKLNVSLTPQKTDKPPETMTPDEWTATLKDQEFYIVSITRQRIKFFGSGRIAGEAVFQAHCQYHLWHMMQWEKTDTRGCFLCMKQRHGCISTSNACDKIEIHDFVYDRDFKFKN